MAEDRKKGALELARGTAYTNLATCDGSQPHVRLMHWSRIEDDFTVWVATRAESNKARHIKENPKVCLIFAEEIGYVRVFGTAEIVNDRAKKDELWEDQWLFFWPEGKEDPDYRLIKVVPEWVDYLNQALGDVVAQKL